MKEMVYKNDFNTLEVLETGVYEGYKFAIISKGLYPIACVENKVDADNIEDGRIRHISVHGDFTFCGYSFWSDEKIKYIGWDYGHIGDYNPATPQLNGKRWSVQDIYSEIVKVIEQLKVVEGYFKDIEKRFTYHDTRGDRASKYPQIRQTAKEFAYLIMELCPNTFERSLALTKLEETVMWANAGISREE